MTKILRNSNNLKKISTFENQSVIDFTYCMKVACQTSFNHWKIGTKKLFQS